jgi:hypothetical protein
MTSERTAAFLNASAGIFQTDNLGELWITSALRFFLLEDMMVTKGYNELVHAEADNMLYGRYTTILPVLRAYYPMAVTPLNTRKSLFTASVFWVSNVAHLRRFNDFLLALAFNKDLVFDKYLDWLYIYFCCKQGGVRPNADGMGIKPFAINEMSMLAYYHELHPAIMKLLPAVAQYKYVSTRNIPNVNIYTPKGSEIPAPTGRAIWDMGSYGQFLGGTSRKRGRDKGFTDGTHIAGVVIRVSPCRPYMKCHANISEYDYAPDFTGVKQKKRCYTAPFISCGDGYAATPLWNLHVHSKNMEEFVSKPCDCV